MKLEPRLQNLEHEQEKVSLDRDYWEAVYNEELEARSGWEAKEVENEKPELEDRVAALEHTVANLRESLGEKGSTS